MPFEHSCFISYRNHEKSPLAERFLNDLCYALRSELNVLTNNDIYVDRERVKGGDIIDPALACALCKSACMILIYTPPYFNADKSYCAREYYAMEALEVRRLEKASKKLSKASGLIFPIILRGVLPKEIRDKRHSFDFGTFSLMSKTMAKNPNFVPSIRELSEQIHNRILMLNAVKEDLTLDCEDFALPTEQEIQPWLSSMIARAQPFPNRGG